MKFYYTTTAGAGTERKDPLLSLGGYRSSTPVPNDSLNSLFGDLSEYTLDKNKKEYIALILKNETGVDVTDINIWFDFPTDTYTKFTFGAVELNQDADGNNYMENVGDRYSAPYYTTFSEAEGVANKVNIGDLLSGGEVGIWIRRELYQTNIDADRNGLIYKENPDDRQYLQKELGTVDDISINLEWTA